MLTTSDIRSREAVSLICELVDDYLLVSSERFLHQAELVLDIARDFFSNNQRAALADEIDRARGNAGAKRRRRVLDLMGVVVEPTRSESPREECTREYANAPSTTGAVAPEVDRSGHR